MGERRTDTEKGHSFDLAVEEARPSIKEPPLYRVVLINDDFTPMEFVVNILEGIFGMSFFCNLKKILKYGGRF